MCIKCAAERDGKLDGYEIVQIDNPDPWIDAVNDNGELKTPEEYLPKPCEGATEVIEFGVDLKYYQFVHVKKLT